jgi:choline dehydrogenase
MGLEYVLRRGGPMAVGINQGGLFARAMARRTRPDVQFHFATLSSDMAGSPVHDFPASRCRCASCVPLARFVHLKSADPLAAPAMQPNYLATRTDRATLVAGIVSRARSLPHPRAARAMLPTNTAGRAARDPTTTLLEFAQEHRRHHLPSERHHEDGTGIDPPPWSTPSCACTAATACASSTAGSCRRSCRQHECAGRHDRGEGRGYDLGSE